MFIFQMQETKILDFIYQEKTTHILIYLLFVYLLIFKSPTEHEVIFYDRSVICHPSSVVIDAL